MSSLISEYNFQHAETFPNVLTITKNFIRNTCNRNLIFDRLPILKWLPKYQPSYFPRDLCAGITVGLTAISQGIAYANIAGLDPEVRINFFFNLKTNRLKKFLFGFNSMVYILGLPVFLSTFYWALVKTSQLVSIH